MRPPSVVLSLAACLLLVWAHTATAWEGPAVPEFTAEFDLMHFHAKEPKQEFVALDIHTQDKLPPTMMDRIHPYAYAHMYPDPQYDPSKHSPYSEPEVFDSFLQIRAEEERASRASRAEQQQQATAEATAATTATATATATATTGATATATTKAESKEKIIPLMLGGLAMLAMQKAKTDSIDGENNPFSATKMPSLNPVRNLMPKDDMPPRSLFPGRNAWRKAVYGPRRRRSPYGGDAQLPYGNTNPYQGPNHFQHNSNDMATPRFNFRGAEPSMLGGVGGNPGLAGPAYAGGGGSGMFGGGMGMGGGGVIPTMPGLGPISPMGYAGAPDASNNPLDFTPPTPVAPPQMGAWSSPPNFMPSA